MFLISFTMRSNILLSLGFFFLGFLTGYLTGISDSEISKSVIGTLLALFGGKLFFEILKKDDNDRMRIGVILIFFSISFLISFNIAVYVKVNRLFTPEKFRETEIKEDIKKDNPYWRDMKGEIDSTHKK